MTRTLRPPAAWVDDLAWHRHMLRQSRLRWTHENAMAIALHFTRGQLEYRTNADLERLSGQQLALLDEASAARRTIGPLLVRVQQERHVSWLDALDVIGLSQDEAQLIRQQAALQGSGGTRETKKVTAGLPWSNPLTEIWELLQLSALYGAAVAILEDAICDLADELVTEWRDLKQVAPLTSSRTAGQLLLRLEDNRVTRGGPGDPRREHAQRYEVTNVRPSATGSVPAQAI